MPHRQRIGEIRFSGSSVFLKKVEFETGWCMSES